MLSTEKVITNDQSVFIGGVGACSRTLSSRDSLRKKVFFVAEFNAFASTGMGVITGCNDS